MTDHLKERAKKAQEELLEIVLEVLKAKNDWFKKAPSYITNELDLFKQLNTKGRHEFGGTENHRFAQGLINELINRGELEHKKDKGYRYIGK